MGTSERDFGKIEPAHVEQACRAVASAATERAGGSYFVKYAGRELPAKRVLREAYRLAHAREISAREFSGGQFVARILERLGFEVVVRRAAGSDASES